MSGTPAAEVPDLVPARMVNEFSYCPRLFFLEWVQARFEDSADTVEGRYRHRVVDQEGGAAPLPDEGELLSSRSVLLSSPRLGIVGRVDVVEGVGDEVRPVDYKRGSPPDTPERSWEPERVQLCVNGLLLRDAGYRCDEGVLYFVEARRRVVVPFDEELVTKTAGLLAELRQVAAADLPPRPLVDSPKCPRCSLVGICLPDETNALAARSDRPVRRLLPRDPAARPVYVAEQGTTLGHRQGRLEVTKKGELIQSVRMIDVSQVSVYGNVQVSAQLLRQLFAREIPVCWFSYGGRFQGIAEGLPSKHVDLRRRQVALAYQGGLAIACRMVEGKVRNARTLLSRNGRQRDDDLFASLKDLADHARVATSVATLLGLEGAAARLYFSAFSTMLRDDLRLPGAVFSFEGRNRRPPLDAVNCLLSYLYSLLVKDLTAVTYGVGFDPYIGFFHRPRFGRPALGPRRGRRASTTGRRLCRRQPCQQREVKPSHFVVRAGGVSLTAEGRKVVIAGYERRLETEIRHPTFGYKVIYRRVLEVQARVLAAHLLGEVPDYVPFVTR